MKPNDLQGPPGDCGGVVADPSPAAPGQPVPAGGPGARPEGVPEPEGCRVAPPSEPADALASTAKDTAQSPESAPSWRRNLLPGGNESVKAARVRKQERAASERERRLKALESPEGVLHELRLLVLEGGDTAGTNAARQLLEAYRPDGVAQCQRLCCKQDTLPVPKTVSEWLDQQYEIELRGRAAWYREQGRCFSCRGPAAKEPAPRRCAEFHKPRAVVPADEMRRAEEMAGGVHCELCHRHRRQATCTCRSQEWARIEREARSEQESESRLAEIFRGMNGDGGHDGK